MAAGITLLIFGFLVFTSSQYSYLTTMDHFRHDVTEEEFNHPYFTPGSDVITPIDDKYLINGEEICEGIKPNSVLLLIPSVASDMKMRNLLRRTWLGAVLKGEWPNEKLEYEFRAAFIFGNGKTQNDNQALQRESSINGDIVQGSFVDSYLNLTRKTLFGLKWVSRFCQNARYVMKIDVDTFVHIPKLFKKIAHYGDSPHGKIFGRLWEKSMPHRTGKWKIAHDDYPVNYYPPYCDGPIYVISGSAVSRLVYTSERMPYLHLEDVFVTGIVARISKVNRIDVLQNVNFRDSPEWVCSFRLATDDLPVHLADSEFSAEQIEAIWRCMKDGPSWNDFYLYYTGEIKYDVLRVVTWNILIISLIIIVLYVLNQFRQQQYSLRRSG